jgi:hypothetical protein
MNRDEVIQKLNNEVLLAAAYFQSLPAEKFFTRSVPEKWSPAENAQHLVLSVKPLAMAFSLPKFLLRLMFGKPNRAGRSFDEVVEKYKAKLAAGGKASSPYIPRNISHNTDPKKVIEEFTKAYANFTGKISSVSEPQLDLYLLPHPLLGKLTLREMLYFTVHHVSHHHELVRSRLTSA